MATFSFLNNLLFGKKTKNNGIKTILLPAKITHIYKDKGTVELSYINGEGIQKLQYFIEAFPKNIAIGSHVVIEYTIKKILDIRIKIKLEQKHRKTSEMAFIEFRKKQNEESG